MPSTTPTFSARTTLLRIACVLVPSLVLLSFALHQSVANGKAGSVNWNLTLLESSVGAMRSDSGGEDPQVWSEELLLSYTPPASREGNYVLWSKGSGDLDFTLILEPEDSP